MNINKLIKELTHLKDCGVKYVSIVDTHWNDFEMESLEMNGESDLAFMQIQLIEE